VLPHFGHWRPAIWVIPLLVRIAIETKGKGSRMKKTKQNEMRAGAVCIRLGRRHAHSFAIRKVPIVMIAANADPIESQLWK
jgi:hypothetical protein